ncbi:unnamed protein product [Paramecium sonneborni]|uniref:Transmembrane protein n=1 Tax=Paramecium sonneborni TaxID=65129 RepID=A0A8S1M4A9_9CILI|nr:unnamed protein product [Paramecium sonneborni]
MCCCNFILKNLQLSLKEIAIQEIKLILIIKDPNFQWKYIMLWRKFIVEYKIKQFEVKQNQQKILGLVKGQISNQYIDLIYKFYLHKEFWLALEQTFNGMLNQRIFRNNFIKLAKCLQQIQMVSVMMNKLIKQVSFKIYKNTTQGRIKTFIKVSFRIVFKLLLELNIKQIIQFKAAQNCLNYLRKEIIYQISYLIINLIMIKFRYHLSNVLAFQRCESFLFQNYSKYSFSNVEKENKNEKQQTDLEKQNMSKKQGYVAKMREEIITNAIVASLKEKGKLKAKEEYRAAILFEEILNREVDIKLYDTKGRAFIISSLWNFFWVVFASLGLYTIFRDDQWYKKKMEIFKVAITTGFILTRFIKQRQFYKYQVEKVVYNTKSKQFTITKRNIIGIKQDQVLQKDHILYTSDKDLNFKKINYININTLECYGIGFDYAWLKKDLFSHLIQQNIS